MPFSFTARTLALLVVLTGCGASIGQKVDMKAVDSVKTCTTTRAEVDNTLPPPQSTGRIGDLTLLRWAHVHVSMGSHEQQDVRIALDPSGTVVDVAVNPPAGYQPVNRCKDGSTR